MLGSRWSTRFGIRNGAGTPVMCASETSGQRATLLAFGQMLKRLRVAADLTQEELAERAMISARSISDLERTTGPGAIPCNCWPTACA